MNADDLVDWLAPPPGEPRSCEPVAPDQVADHVGLFHSPRRCAWSFAVMDDRRRVRLPMPNWAGQPLLLVASSASLVVAEWRWFSGKAGPLADFSVEARADSRVRLQLPPLAMAHLDVHPGDPVAIGVEREGELALHLAGPATFERVVGDWK